MTKEILRWNHCNILAWQYIHKNPTNASTMNYEIQTLWGSLQPTVTKGDSQDNGVVSFLKTLTKPQPWTCHTMTGIWSISNQPKEDFLSVPIHILENNWLYMLYQETFLFVHEPFLNNFQNTYRSMELCAGIKKNLTTSTRYYPCVNKIQWSKTEIGNCYKKEL